VCVGILFQQHDGTPCAVKVACTVWSGGKLRDNFKELPIAIPTARVKVYIGAGIIMFAIPLIISKHTENRYQ
jgi:hypothetical protein